jgi:hypothetical protein
MGTDEIESVFPAIKFIIVRNFGNDNIEKYDGGSGTGWGMISDWNVYAKITDKPYGSGAFYVQYKKIFVKMVSPSTFLSGFKNDLITKYGKPKYEITDEDQSYFACWGSGCNQNFNSLHSTEAQYSAVRAGKISIGKYLIVTFDNNPDLNRQEIVMTLFDTGPYSVIVEQQKKEETLRSREKIKF